MLPMPPDGPAASVRSPRLLATLAAALQPVDDDTPEKPPLAILRELVSPWTVLVAVVGIALRVWVLRSSEGELLADEAYTGLQAMGVLDGRFPVVVDGNRYTAVLESYLLAVPLAVIGPSILLLKLFPMLFWALAAVLTYGAARHLAGRRAAGVAASLVWLAPGALLVVSTLSYVGYASGMAVCTATLWVAARLADRDAAAVRHSALVGFLAGLGFYVHPMYSAVLVPVVAVLCWTHRREGRAFWVPFALAGIAANMPFLLWNAVNGFPSLEVQNALPGTYTDRLRAFAERLVPRGLGLRDSTFDWIVGRPAGLLLYAAVVAAVVAGSAVIIRCRRRPSSWMVPAALAGCWPIMALFSPLIFAVDGRYNVVAFPFAAIAVGAVVEARPLRADRWRVAAPVAVVACWTAVLVVPHGLRELDIDDGGPNDTLASVVDLLEARDIRWVNGSYWTVLPVEFLSDRGIVGAVLAPDAVRFPGRQREVESRPPEDVAFVFPDWADDPARLWMAPERYERIVVGNTVVYLPLPAA